MDEVNVLTALFAQHKKHKAKRLAALLKYELFTEIYQQKGEQNFSQIVDNIQFRQYQFGFNIIENRERTFSYIVKGAAMIFVCKQDRNVPILHKRIGQNEYFGQKTIYNNMKLHSVKSVSKTYVLELDLYTFYKTFSGFFKYTQLKQKILYLQKIWVFRQIKKRDIERILLLSKTVEYKKNTIIFKPNTTPDFAYLILGGELSLFRGKQSYRGFKTMGETQICGLQEINHNSLYEYGCIAITQYVTILLINRKLVSQIFHEGIDSNMYYKKQRLNENIIVEKQQKQIKRMVKEMSEREQDEEGRRRRRYHSQTIPKQQTVFRIDRVKISKVNRLKNKNLRQHTLEKVRKDERSLQSNLGLSTYSNSGFTQDKQLLLSYLVKKERKQKHATIKELQYQEQSIYVIPQLPVERSTAVKNQKRKLKKSRRNAQSLSSLY